MTTDHMRALSDLECLQLLCSLTPVRAPFKSEETIFPAHPNTHINNLAAGHRPTEQPSHAFRPVEQLSSTFMAATKLTTTVQYSASEQPQKYKGEHQLMAKVGLTDPSLLAPTATERTPHAQPRPSSQSMLRPLLHGLYGQLPPTASPHPYQ
jgi:hypothetical protein